MNVSDALTILALTPGCTQEEIKQAYRRACAKYHPDRNPAGAEMMKLVNIAYEALKTYQGEEVEQKGTFDAAYVEHLEEVINKLINLPGLHLEICGAWLWITGDTRPHKEEIKLAGCYWSKPKTAWYYRPSEYKSSNRGNWSLDKIREHHGSQSVRQKKRSELEAA